MNYYYYIIMEFLELGFNQYVFYYFEYNWEY